MSGLQAERAGGGRRAVWVPTRAPGVVRRHGGFRTVGHHATFGVGHRRDRAEMVEVVVAGVGRGRGRAVPADDAEGEGVPIVGAACVDEMSVLDDVTACRLFVDALPRAT